MLGYLAGPRLGATNTYFTTKPWLLPWALRQPGLLLAGAVLLFHSAFGRLLGYADVFD